MKLKKMSNTKMVLILTVMVLGIGGLIYALFAIAGVNEKSKFFILVGLGIALIFNIGRTVIKLKREGVIYDEREGHIEEKSNSISFTVFQIVVMLLVLLTYKAGEIKINISGLLFFLLLIMWLIYGIANFFIKRRI